MCWSTGYIASCWWSSSRNHPLALLNRLCLRDISFDQIIGFFTSVVFSCTCQIIPSFSSFWIQADKFWKATTCPLEVSRLFEVSNDVRLKLWTVLWRDQKTWIITSELFRSVAISRADSSPVVFWQLSPLCHLWYLSSLLHLYLIGSLIKIQNNWICDYD